MAEYLSDDEDAFAELLARKTDKELLKEQKRCEELQIHLSPEELEAFIEEASVFLNSDAVEIADDGQFVLKQENAEIPQALLPVVQQVCAERPDFLSVQITGTAE